MKSHALPALVILITYWISVPISHARGLTFEERVDAQEAIDRVYYSHQIGATKPFEDALPRPVIEAKVREYLQQSVALEEFWHTPITGEMLRRETERMVRGTRMPGRLRELFAALDDDPVLIQECLVRPGLVSRLIHSFFSSDERVHAVARREADGLRETLNEGSIDPHADHPRRTLHEFLRAQTGPSTDRWGGTIELSAEDFDRQREDYPAAVGEISRLREERARFVVSVVLDDESDRFRVASFAVPKQSFDDWWSEVEAEWDELSVDTVAAGPDPIPALVETLKNKAEPFDPAAGGDVDPTGMPCVADDTWDNGILDDVPFPHYAPESIWTGSEMIVWGGGLGHFLVSLRYDPATDTWTPTSTTNAQGFYTYGTAVWTGSEMIVWGGGLTTPVNTGGRYDPLTDTWASVSTVNAPSPRSEHAAVWTGSEMIVWGGFDGTYVLGTGGRYDPATDSWMPTSLDNAPSARRDFNLAVWTGDVMIVWGGVGEDGILNTGGRYHLETDSWTPTSTTNAPAARARHQMVWTGDRMIAWGGVTDDPTNTGGVYDPESDSWMPTSTINAPEGRFLHSAVWTGDRMIVWGGTVDFHSGPVMDTGGLYEPETDSWTPTTTTNAPEGRDFHTTVWTGELMIVWGGGGEDVGELVTGGRYDPLTDSWTPTSWSHYPEPRSWHTAVWTGNQMIVWGGGGGHEGIYRGRNTGGRYDPATDSWMPTSLDNVPSERRDHTAVWTGSRMIVWGGWEDFSGTEKDTGGLYDPLTDTWTPTSTQEAPLHRRNHTAVWTGSQMIVYGGKYASANLHTGGRYDPETDTWLEPLPLVDGPGPRQSHTAVWTGAQMIVWGGENEAPLSSGGRYDPSTNTWLGPTSMVDAPYARKDHTAVWTGAEMIVWGGFRDTGLASGGRYDPVTNTWSPTSVSDAPSARFRHTAVWTGGRMVVWGGAGSDRNGGRYDPLSDDWTPTSLTDAPSGRHGHSAVWTGGLMIVWGGSGLVSSITGGRYALDNAVDDDGDGLSECDGDCNDVDAGAFSVPAEVTGVTLAGDKETIDWISAAPGAGSATVHDVVRGVLSAPESEQGICLASGLAADTMTDPDVPAPGEGFWYLVRGRNSCGPGSFGSRSDGTPRSSPVCP